MDYYSYRFEAIISKYDFGKYYYTVVFIPQDIIEKLPLNDNPRLRIEGEVNEFPINGALMPDKGEWYLMVPKKILKQIDKNLGDEVEILFRIADQDEVTLSKELENYLKRNPKLKSKWEKLTPGKRRGLAHRVNQAKSEETIAKRLLELKNLLLAK
jgi:antitoxin component of MazEF toxin-antitoxin module